MKLILCLVIVMIMATSTLSRKHLLNIEMDERKIIPLTTFGFHKGGYLDVHLMGLQVLPKEGQQEMIGFTVDRTLSAGTNPYPRSTLGTCALNNYNLDYEDEGVSSIFFRLDFTNELVHVNCNPTLQTSVKVYRDSSLIPMSPYFKRGMYNIDPRNVILQRRRRRVRSLGENAKEVQPEEIGTTNKFSASESAGACNGISLPLSVTPNPDGSFSYSTTFTVYTAGEDSGGLYSLFFHNCDYTHNSKVNINISVIEENLHKNYLSAGEMPLPAIYFMMSILFFIFGCFWGFILKKSKEETGLPVFKIHYLMGALVCLKSLSLLLQSVNYHYIQTEGTNDGLFSFLYYLTHMLKGTLLFTTILCIGTGYSFVKHTVSSREKTVFMLVIPAQIIASVAEIVMNESEKSETAYSFWKTLFLVLDLSCCGAILLPVVWSIKQSKESSHTNGIKAAKNLEKLFRHFYFILVCYIYVTRIVASMLLKITVPFQYEWIDEKVIEMTTFICFVLTGYKFRPAALFSLLCAKLQENDKENETENKGN